MAVSSSDLKSAISELAQTLREKAYSEDIVTRIAEDWDVNEALLLRNFITGIGMEPREYASRFDGTEAIRRAATVTRAFTFGLDEHQKVVISPDGPLRAHGCVVTDRFGRNIMLVSVTGGVVRFVELGKDEMDEATLEARFTDLEGLIAALQAAGASYIEA